MILLITTLNMEIVAIFSAGVAVGAGLQGTVAIVNICCYYVIGIPLGVVLAYVAHLEVKVIRNFHVCLYSNKTHYLAEDILF